LETSEFEASPLFLRVAVPVPSLDLLTYKAPEDFVPPVGARVVVPLGSRHVTGLVVEVLAVSDLADGDVKPVRQVLDRSGFVPEEGIALARWTAEYYAAGEGETITAVLPPKARGARADAHKTIRIASVTVAGTEALQSVDAGELTARQREAL